MCNKGDTVRLKSAQGIVLQVDTELTGMAQVQFHNYKQPVWLPIGKLELVQKARTEMCNKGDRVRVIKEDDAYYGQEGTIFTAYSNAGWVSGLMPDYLRFYHNEYLKLVEKAKPEPAGSKSFWCCYREGTGGCYVQHVTEEEAITEAKRLAQKHPGSEVYVLQAIKSYKAEVAMIETIFWQDTLGPYQSVDCTTA